MCSYIAILQPQTRCADLLGDIRVLFDYVVSECALDICVYDGRCWGPGSKKNPEIELQGPTHLYESKQKPSRLFGFLV